MSYLDVSATEQNLPLLLQILHVPTVTLEDFKDSRLGSVLLLGRPLTLK